MPKKQTKTRSTSVKTRVNKRVKLAVVPHKANQYRPLAVRRYGIVFILMLVLLAQGVYNGLTSGNIMGTQAQVTSAGLLQATNEARAKEGAAPLKLNEKLSQAAQQKVQSMFDQQYWAHVAPDGTTPWYWFAVVDYNYADAGENLAKNFTTSNSAVSAWLSSPTHRANVLKQDYQDVGFAVLDGQLNGQPTTLIVALYAAPEISTVQGSMAHTASSNINTSLSFMSRLGLGIQAMTPAAVSSIILLLIAANVALAAHLYRRRLPLGLRRSWYRHHGAYKAGIFTCIAIVIVFAYGGVGQI